MTSGKTTMKYKIIKFLVFFSILCLTEKDHALSVPRVLTGRSALDDERAKLAGLTCLKVASFYSC